jgi:hypothetical protein
MPTASRTATAPPEGAVLVRVPAEAARWVVQLPPLPPGPSIGVTVGHPSLASQRAELAARGYRLLATVGGRDPGPHADVLVPAALRDTEQRWFASLILVASRVYDLAFGPVLTVLHDELEVHLAALPDAATTDGA